MIAESRWTELFEAALAIIDRTNADHTVVDRWTFGGGTAMMLQLGHRDSFDVDLLVPGPQVLGYLSAASESMSFKPGRPTYTGEAIVMNRSVRMERENEASGRDRGQEGLAPGR